MKRIGKIERDFLITLGCFSLVSLSMLLLPFDISAERTGLTPLGLAIGVTFWLGILSGSVLYFLVSRKYRAKLIEILPKRKVPGCLRVFGSPVTAAVDVVFVLSLAGSIYCSVGTGKSRILEFAAMFLCVTSFYLHFLVTGRVFQYIEQIKVKELGKHEGKTKVKRKIRGIGTDLCDDSRNDC